MSSENRHLVPFTNFSINNIDIPLEVLEVGYGVNSTIDKKLPLETKLAITQEMLKKNMEEGGKIADEYLALKKQLEEVEERMERNREEFNVIDKKDTYYFFKTKKGKVRKIELQIKEIDKRLTSWCLKETDSRDWKISTKRKEVRLEKIIHYKNQLALKTKELEKANDDLQLQR